MATHQLKIRPEYYKPVLEGKKTFEVRYDDRGFQEGDTLILKEWQESGFTGRESSYDVAYILRDFDAIRPGFVIMSIVPHHSSM